VSANGYTGVYDGNAYGISVSASDATISYGEVAGTYNLASSPKYTNAGEYTVYYQVSKAGYDTVTGSEKVVITKATGTVTAPTAKTLTYNESAQALINPGSSNTGTIEYKVGNGTYSTAIPTAINPGTYTVYYRVIGDANHLDIAEKSLTVKISEANLTYTSAGYTGVYDGNSYGITVSSSKGTIMYGTTSGTYNLTSSPTYTNAGTYTVYYQVTKTGYTTVTGSRTVTISKATGSITTAPTGKSLTYTGSAQTLITAGSSSTGSMRYKVGSNGTYSSSLPTATNAGTYTVYYYSSGDANHYSSSTYSIDVTISKAAGSVTAPTGKSLTYTGSSQTLISA
jgi:methionine-rich copper-binding protein CopC